MWIYPAQPRTLILGGQQPIAPCLPFAPGRRSVVAILRLGSRGPDCGTYHFSHAPTLTIGSNVGLLVGCSEDQLAQHWSDN